MVIKAMSSIKVAFLSHYKPCAIGYADYAFHLVNSLAELCPKCIFVVLGCKCDIRCADVKINEKVRNKNVAVNRILKKNSLFSIVRIVNFLAKSRVKNLYIYYPLEFFMSSTLAPILNLILPLTFLPLTLTKNIRLIIDLDSIHKPHQKGLKEKAFLMLQLTILKLLQSLGAVIVCRNIVAWRLLIDMGFSDKCVKYIPHGVPCDSSIVQDEVNEIRRQWRLNKGPVILYWGFISRYKGIDYLIKALKYVTGEFADVKLVISGDYFNPFDKYNPKKHKYLRYLRMLVKSLELEEKVVFITKHLTEDEMSSLLASSDIVVLPYVTKNLSASGVLARIMGFGKPIIVSDCGWFTGYVFNGVNGIVVKQGDEHALAEAILQLLRDPYLRGKLVENMRILADRLKWSSVARRWLEVFQ
jgi:glycosyltransferase involved in cell wall biosynthesis